MFISNFKIEYLNPCHKDESCFFVFGFLEFCFLLLLIAKNALIIINVKDVKFEKSLLEEKIDYLEQRLKEAKCQTAQKVSYLQFFNT